MRVARGARRRRTAATRPSAPSISRATTSWSRPPTLTVSARASCSRRDAARARARDRVRSGAARRSRDALPQRDRRTGGEDDRRVRRAVLAGRRLQRPELGTGLGVRGHHRRVADRRAAPGVLASFTFGPRRRADATALDPAERRRPCSTSLVRRFGPRAASPSDFVETAWWTRGVDPGLLDGALRARDPHALRPPAARAVGPHPLGGHRDRDDLVTARSTARSGRVNGRRPRCSPPSRCPSASTCRLR